MARQVRDIVIRVDARGAPNLKALARQMDSVANSTRRTARDVSTLKNAFLAIQGFQIAGIGLSSIVEMSDSIQLLTDRISVFEGSGEKALDVVNELAQTATDTATSTTGLAESYSRMALALSDANIGSSQLLKLTRSLQQSFRISGASISEATAATIQLSQGLASGQLRGQELRSVLEANAVIGGILAEKLGTTRGELLRFAEKRGGITAQEVIAALTESFDSLEKSASKLELTIGQAVTIAMNKLQIGVLNLNKTIGISSGISKAIVFLADNAVPSLTAALGVALYFNIEKVTASLSRMYFQMLLTNSGSISLSRGLLTLGTSLKGLLVGAASLTLVTAAFAAAGYAVSNWDKVLNAASITAKGASVAFRNLGHDISDAWDDITSGRLPRTISDLAYAMGNVNAMAEAANARSLIEFGGAAKEMGFDYKQAAEDLEQTYDKLSRRFVDVLPAKNLAELNKRFDEGTISAAAYDKRLREIKIAEVLEKFSSGKIDRLDKVKQINEILFGKKAKNKNEFTEQLAKLNRQFGTSGDVAKYTAELEKLSQIKLGKDFQSGAVSLQAYNESIGKMRATQLNRQINEGTISFRQFNAEVEKNRIDSLNREFKEGKINLYEYSAQLNEISSNFDGNSALIQGVADAIENMGTLSSNVAGAITNTFSTLENSLVSFIETGKFNFREFTQSILSDLNRIIIRATIIRPLAEGILGSFGAADTSGASESIAAGGQASTLSAGYAKGGAFNRGWEFFANGGIVNSPTAFSFNGGRRGVMGEAGPEAIVPLKRGANGDLGVQAISPVVNVNIINNSDAQVETRETTNSDGKKEIEVLILSTVRNGIAKGSLDKDMKTAYGLNRRGY